MECKSCKNEIKNGNQMGCPNCGASLCADCAKSTIRICPYCYHDLEFIG